MEAVSRAIYETSVHIQCPRCDNWENINGDEPRHHMQSFKILDWYLDEPEVSHTMCLVCEKEFKLVWDS